MKFSISVALFGLICVCSSTGANTLLFNEIATSDTEFFTAFNQCDVETFSEYLSKDLEFYHDVAGVSGFQQTLNSVAGNCARNLGLTRTLVDGSMEVFPIKDYGAIQKGTHTFCHVEQGVEDCGTFEFLHIWLQDNSGWKLTRVVSYDH